MDETIVNVGRVMGAFGLRGEMKVEVLTAFPELRFKQGARLRLRGRWVEVEGMRWQQDRMLLKIQGIDDVDEAKKLHLAYLEGPADERPDLAEGEYLISDLVGLRVVSEDGEELGKVDKVDPFPAQDILFVGEILIPLVDDFVRNVDLDAGVVTVRLIPGMKPEES
jgi:16S rRNA processing protein RimM